MGVLGNIKSSPSGEALLVFLPGFGQFLTPRLPKNNFKCTSRASIRIEAYQAVAMDLRTGAWKVVAN
jgi:hypothetical protein